MRNIIIGARGSALSLIQADIVKRQLEKSKQDIKCTIKTISTKGDKDMSPIPLDSVGKGWFTKELDSALIEGTIDLAVHSLKDLPEELSQELMIAAIPRREDAREAFVAKENIPFAQLRNGAVIGTDSIRRKVQLQQKRQDLKIKSIRGNVNTRLVKLDNGEYDGLFLAVAGLKRLGLENRITQYFSVTDIIPSPGQGALAIVIMKNNTTLLSLLQKLNHTETVTAVKVERAFSRVFGGGCKIPVGAYAECNGNIITLYGVIGSLDGKYIIKGSLNGNFSSSKTLGKRLATRLLQKSKILYTNISEKYVVITRPEKENQVLQKKLEVMGLYVFSYPSIKVIKNNLVEKYKQQLRDIKSFDYIVFTSKNGVKFFIQELLSLHIDSSSLQGKHIAVVGPQTAKEAKKYNLLAQTIPEKFTTEDLARALHDIKDKKILLPRADIATPLLANQLKKKGGIVTDIPIYKTQFITETDNKFKELLRANKIYCIVFTSPSTVIGFLKKIGEKGEFDKIISLPVLSIGPVTTKALIQSGFQNIHTADTFTVEGIIIKLKESIL
ncbi:MAG TPA: hydroxymethylbilane synthase [Candidatus Sulfotelmatobacter sp.]|jgi:hydroxymethylbilane synthase|nr:hydroxymethylbilane synthase [Candidatus Sulfotelmatobacter sp.]